MAQKVTSVIRSKMVTFDAGTTAPRGAWCSVSTRADLTGRAALCKELSWCVHQQSDSHIPCSLHRTDGSSVPLHVTFCKLHIKDVQLTISVPYVCPLYRVSLLYLLPSSPAPHRTVPHRTLPPSPASHRTAHYRPALHRTAPRKMWI